MILFEDNVIANGIKLHVYRTNEDKPPLIFAHGMSDNGLCYWPIAEELADAYEIILYDSRNHGMSEGVEGSNLIDRANDLAGLVAVLGLDKPKLVGHSLGAATIALFAGLYPDMPGCIVLEDPPPFETMVAVDEQAVAGRAQWRESAAANKEKSIEELVEMNRQENPTWPEAERVPWAVSKKQFNLNAFDEKRINAAIGNQIVGQIACPTLLVTADTKLGSLYPPAAAEELAAAQPNFEHVAIPGAGHNVRREQPEAFLMAVRDFLAECD